MSELVGYTLAAPVRFHVFAGFLYAGALAYILIALYVLPILRLPPLPKALGTLFFLLGAGTVVELGVHAVADQPAWLMSRHAWSLAVAQAVIDWAFILSVRPWRRTRIALVFRDGDHRPAIEEHDLVGETLILDEHGRRRR